MADFYKHIGVHANLITEYLNILSFISKREGFLTRLSWIFKRPPNPIDHTPYAKFLVAREIIALNFFISLFAESHIKSKLKQISDLYFQIAQSIPDYSDNSCYKKWLIQNAEYTQKFSDQLTSWKSIRGLIGLLLPLFVGSLLSSLKDLFNYAGNPNLTNSTLFNSIVSFIGDRYTLISFLSFLLPIFLYLWLFLSISFKYKRTLFLPKNYIDSDFYNSWKYEKAGYERSIYKIEDDLFNLIARNKKKESLTDVFAKAIVISLFCATIIYAFDIFSPLINNTTLKFHSFYGYKIDELFMINIYFTISLIFFIIYSFRNAMKQQMDKNAFIVLNLPIFMILTYTFLNYIINNKYDIPLIYIITSIILNLIIDLIYSYIIALKRLR